MLAKRLLATLLSAYCAILVADDTELFVADISSENSIRPQVLIIFDNSGSMKSEEEVAKTPYNSDDYVIVTDSKIYWSDDGEIPSSNSEQYFTVNQNNCKASISPLASTGFYNGNVYRWGKNKKEWKSLKIGKSGSNLGNTFDCEDDYIFNYPSNPGTNDGDGYPVNGNSGPYASTQGSNVFSNDSVVLYAESYVKWNEESSSTKMSRIAIAKNAISNLINSTPSVDFGLEVFNHNDGDKSNNRNGGRIAHRVMTRDDGEMSDLLETIDDLEAKTWTPLCESMYEAYRYYAGEAVYFGDDDSNSSPSRDKSAEDNAGSYISPFQACQEEAYIILMTDGQPTYDDSVDDEIKTLTGNGAVENSHMPSLSEWMYSSDIDRDSSNGYQHIKTYTIGFGKTAVDSAGKLLTQTAELGGGEYYPATDATALQNAFQATILDILSDASSLSSPAISSNNFDRTRSLDSVYYAMFLPGTSSVWQGNIKKLTMNSDGIIVDRLGEPAIDENGNIKDTASTYWGGDEDGNTVTEGGVSALFETATSRKVLSNIDTASASVLKEPNLANLKAYYSVTTDDDLATELDVDEDELSASLSWLTGIDVDDQDDDGSSTDYRGDIFADPLHSQPLGITYTDGTKNIIRLLVGTNAGFLHMFTDNGDPGTGTEADTYTDSVTENWAFIPEELLNTGLSARDTSTTSDHQYGMDLSPIAIKIVGSDGALSKIIAVVGMRRGGSSYYALDITSPDAPKLLWKIDANSSGFEELGQTWSIPSVGTFSYASGGSVINAPGIVFGAGYDTNKDSCTPSDSETCDDSKGRGVYVVNALTGSKIWSTGGVTCGDNDVHCMRDSIPSQVELLDSDSNGYTDRIYAGDTGGNVWRMDLKGSDTTKWSTIKLAALGGDSAAEDRRFFSPPTLVRTYKNNVTKLDDDGDGDTSNDFTYVSVPYDGVLIGSGDRAHPVSSINVNDAYFSIQDYVISPTLFGEGSISKPTPKTISDLYSIESNPVGNATTDTQKLTAYAEMSGYSGWKYMLTGIGEKSLGQGAVLEGTSYFTSFVPNSTVNVECGVGDFGLGWLYAIDLHSGEHRLSNNSSSDDSDEAVAKIEIGARVPDSLVTHSGSDDDGNSVIRLLGVGQGDQQVTYKEDGTTVDEVINTGTVDTGTDLMPRRIYTYFLEN